MKMTSASHERSTRWASEVAFFDEAAADAEAMLKPIDPAVIARYSGKLRWHNLEEYRYRVLGDLRGKRLLDVGCGDGANSVLLARLGASVTGVDISPAAISLAGKRAALNGVGDHCEFVCAPLETVPLAPGSFDIV